MNIERGSVWRKWDFHVHTPYSILNNNYGVNPYEEKWDEATTVSIEFHSRCVMPSMPPRANIRAKEQDRM